MYLVIHGLYSITCCQSINGSRFSVKLKATLQQSALTLLLSRLQALHLQQLRQEPRTPERDMRTVSNAAGQNAHPIDKPWYPWL